MYIHSSDSAKIMHEARVAELTADFAAAQRDVQRIKAVAAKIANFVNQQVANLTAGLNQGNNGTFAPSA